MKSITLIVYDSFDGKRFDNYEECWAYECLHNWTENYLNANVNIYYPTADGYELLHWNKYIEKDEVSSYYSALIGKIVIHNEEGLTDFRSVAEVFKWAVMKRYINAPGTWVWTYDSPTELKPLGTIRFVKIEENEKEN